MTLLAAPPDTAVASTLLVIAVFVFFLPALLAGFLARARGRSFIIGLLLGGFLSWLGVLLCLFLPAPPPAWPAELPPPPVRRRR